MVADLPHLRPEDLDSVVEEHLATGQSLYVADRLGAGTTFLIHAADRRPGIGFGWNSAAMHDRLGYRPALTATDGLRTDLDSREDLDRLADRIFRGPTAPSVANPDSRAVPWGVSGASASSRGHAAEAGLDLVGGGRGGLADRVGLLVGDAEARG